MERQMGKYDHYSSKQIVEHCLSKGNEGDYWDFKLEWHDRMDNLIKDIICFTNTAHDENCYLIFGISDDLQVMGMKNQRVELSKILDTISNMNFAGDIAPSIGVDTIFYRGVNIDLLTIYNTDKTPVFLQKSYGDMKEGNIYLRIGDRNTPKKSNAKLHDIEKLWKKRFGLLKPVIEYIHDKLSNKDEWTEEAQGYHNKYFPQYKITILPDDDRPSDRSEFYSYAMTNKKTSFRELEIKHSDTVLESYQLVILDGYRYTTVTPEWEFIQVFDDRYKDKYKYKYFVKNTPRHSLHRFLYRAESDDERIAYNDFMDVILEFESYDEKLLFDRFIKENQEIVDAEIAAVPYYNYIQSDNEKMSAHYKLLLKTGAAFKRLLSTLRDASN